MGECLGFKAWCMIDEFWKYILGMFIGVATQGCQGLQFSHRFQPKPE